MYIQSKVFFKILDRLFLVISTRGRETVYFIKIVFLVFLFFFVLGSIRFVIFVKKK